MEPDQPDRQPNCLRSGSPLRQIDNHIAILDSHGDSGPSTTAAIALLRRMRSKAIRQRLTETLTDSTDPGARSTTAPRLESFSSEQLTSIDGFTKLLQTVSSYKSLSHFSRSGSPSHQSEEGSIAANDCAASATDVTPTIRRADIPRRWSGEEYIETSRIQSTEDSTIESHPRQMGRLFSQELPGSPSCHAIQGQPQHSAQKKHGFLKVRRTSYQRARTFQHGFPTVCGCADVSNGNHDVSRTEPLSMKKLVQGKEDEQTDGTSSDFKEAILSEVETEIDRVTDQAVDTETDEDGRPSTRCTVFDAFDGLPHPFWGVEVEQSSWVSVPNPSKLDPECKILKMLRLLSRTTDISRHDSTVLVRHYKPFLKYGIFPQKLFELWAKEASPKRSASGRRQPPTSFQAAASDEIFAEVTNQLAVGDENAEPDSARKGCAYPTDPDTSVHRPVLHQKAAWSSDDACDIPCPVDPTWRNVYSSRLRILRRPKKKPIEDVLRETKKCLENNVWGGVLNPPSDTSAGKGSVSAKATVVARGSSDNLESTTCSASDTITLDRTNSIYGERQLHPMLFEAAQTQTNTALPGRGAQLKRSLSSSEAELLRMGKVAPVPSRVVSLQDFGRPNQSQQADLSLLDASVVLGTLQRHGFPFHRRGSRSSPFELTQDPPPAANMTTAASCTEELSLRTHSLCFVPPAKSFQALDRQPEKAVLPAGSRARSRSISTPAELYLTPFGRLVDPEGLSGIYHVAAGDRGLLSSRVVYSLARPSTEASRRSAELLRRLEKRCKLRVRAGQRYSACRRGIVREGKNWLDFHQLRDTRTADTWKGLPPPPVPVPSSILSPRSKKNRSITWPSMIPTLFRGPGQHELLQEALLHVLWSRKHSKKPLPAPSTQKLKAWMSGFMIPHDEKRYRFGDDSWFCNEPLGCFGVCDGVGEMSDFQWRVAGFDCKGFGEDILREAKARIQTIRSTRGVTPCTRPRLVLRGGSSRAERQWTPEPFECTPQSNHPSLMALEAMVAGFYGKTTTWGAATCLIGCFNGPGNRVGLANIGDSRALLLRRGPYSVGPLTVVGGTTPEQHGWNLPVQLARLPDQMKLRGMKGDSRIDDLVRLLDASRASGQDLNDPVESAMLFDFDVQEGDLLLLATDGLWDNLFDTEVAALCGVALSPKDAEWLTGSVFKATAPRDIAKGLCLAAYWKALQHDVETPFTQSISGMGGDYDLGGKPDDITVVAIWIVKESDENSPQLLKRWQEERAARRQHRK